MRKTTDDRHGFRGAVVITVLTVVAMVLLAGAMLTDGFGEGGVFLDGVVLVYALLFLAVAVGVVIALVQRRREIKGGEEDEAKKY